ncbi:hypothetical protein [Methylobacterium mesophilicum]
MSPTTQAANVAKAHENHAQNLQPVALRAQPSARPAASGDLTAVMKAMVPDGFSTSPPRSRRPSPSAKAAPAPRSAAPAPSPVTHDTALATVAKRARTAEIVAEVAQRATAADTHRGDHSHRSSCP